MYIARRSFSKLSDARNAASATAQLAKHAKKEEQGAVSVTASKPIADLKVTRSPSDLIVVSQEEGITAGLGGGLTRLSVAVKAGARYEPPELPGLAHALRNAAPLGTKHCTAFGLAHNLEQLGASLRAVTTRDHTIYNMDCPRENLHDALKFLAYVTTQQEFKPWEVKDAAERMRIELEVYKTQPQIRLIEILHKAAYRGGLANSLYAPDFAYKHFNSQMLSKYVKETFTTNRMSLAGVGISHEQLLTFATDYLKFDTPNSPSYAGFIPKSEAAQVLLFSNASSNSGSRYVGGEIFEDTIDHLAYAALVTEGAGLNKPLDVVALALLRELLGTEPHVKWSDGVSSLSQAAASVTKKPVAISALNISHSDSGLFGFTVVAGAKDIGNVIRAAIDVVQGKAGVDEKRLQAAKTRLIASILMSEEQRGDVVQDLAIQALNSGAIQTTSDSVAMIEKFTLDQLIQVAKRVTSSKPTLAGVGNLSHFPRLADLLRQ